MGIRNIGIIHYGSSNLYSLQNALNKIDFSSQLIDKPNKLKNFDAIFLPGVGSFPVSMKNLEKNGLTEEIKTFIKSGNPFFGICLGFQLLFSKSFEFGEYNGLNILNGEILHLKNKIKVVPNVGWLKVNFNDKNNFYHSKSFYGYFVHSFHSKIDNHSIVNSTSSLDGFTFCSSVIKDNIFATQFHPEKSGIEGLRLIETFLKKF